MNFNGRRYIKFGSKIIDYELVFADRKTLGITVNPDSKIVVKAPRNSPIEKIEEKIRKKAYWIVKQQNNFLSYQPKFPQRKFIGGETHLYLGRQYRLQIIIDRRNSVKILGGLIEVRAFNKILVKNLVRNWYHFNAKKKFKEFADPLINKFLKYNIAPTNIEIRQMPTRWGSCTPKGKIILNPELIKAPKGCIEYVIIHELCHLVHRNHTKKFIELQTREMPDWQKWKMKLEHLMI